MSEQNITAKEAIEQLEHELAHPEETGETEPVGAITSEKETLQFLDWLVAWLKRPETELEQANE